MIGIDMIRNKRIVLCHVEPFIIHVYFFVAQWTALRFLMVYICFIWI